MAAESIYITSSSDRDASNNSRKKYEAIEGDHITLLNIYRAYRFEKYDKKVTIVTIFLVLQKLFLFFISCSLTTDNFFPNSFKEFLKMFVN